MPFQQLKDSTRTTITETPGLVQGHVNTVARAILMVGTQVGVRVRRRTTQYSPPNFFRKKRQRMSIYILCGLERHGSPEIHRRSKMLPEFYCSYVKLKSDAPCTLYTRVAIRKDCG